MKPEIIETAEKWLLGHLNEHSTGNDSFDLLVIPKMEHCRSVSAYCRMLAEDLHWSQNDTTAGQLIGILHDVGRVTQYAEFGTFIDEFSVDHGRRGYTVVSKSNILSSVEPYFRRIILEGIRYHNTRSFSQKAHEESIPFIKLVRDADKLEKYDVTDDFIENNMSSGDQITVLSVDENGPVNQKVIEFIKRNRKIPKKYIKTTLDYYLFQLSWLFDVHYSHTYRRISESGIVEKIIRILPDTQEFRDAAADVSDYLKQASKNDV
ncbi:hypothetical protein ES708_32119 [subsurface metagenome]